MGREKSRKRRPYWRKERAVEKAIDGKPYRKGKAGRGEKGTTGRGEKGAAKGRKCKRVGRKGPRHAFRINYTARFPLPYHPPRRPTIHTVSRRPSLPVPSSVPSGPVGQIRPGTALQERVEGRLWKRRETASFAFTEKRLAFGIYRIGPPAGCRSGRTRRLRGARTGVSVGKWSGRPLAASERGPPAYGCSVGGQRGTFGLSRRRVGRRSDRRDQWCRKHLVSCLSSPGIMGLHQ